MTFPQAAPFAWNAPAHTSILQTPTHHSRPSSKGSSSVKPSQQALAEWVHSSHAPLYGVCISLLVRFLCFTFFPNLTMRTWRDEIVSFTFVPLALSIAFGMVGIYKYFLWWSKWTKLPLTPIVSFIFRVKIGRPAFSWKVLRKPLTTQKRNNHLTLFCSIHIL